MNNYIIIDLWGYPGNSNARLRGTDGLTKVKAFSAIEAAQHYCATNTPLKTLRQCGNITEISDDSSANVYILVVKQ